MFNVFNRLKEPSTWAGIALLGSLFGVKELAVIGSPEVMSGIGNAITGIGAILAVFLREKTL